MRCCQDCGSYGGCFDRQRRIFCVVAAAATMLLLLLPCGAVVQLLSSMLAEQIAGALVVDVAGVVGAFLRPLLLSAEAALLAPSGCVRGVIAGHEV